MKTMKSLKPWQPLADIPAKLHLDSLQDDFTGLKLILSTEHENTPALIVLFEHYFSYRNTDESERMKTLNRYPILTSGKYPFFVLEESDFIEWLKRESLDTLDENLKHFIICTPNDIVDILSIDMPVVSWKC
jgi:hypothetical protein